MADQIKIDLTDLKAKAAAMLAFDSRKDGLILEGVNNTMNRAAKLAITKYMDSKSREFGLFVSPEGVCVQQGTPPNPPPGPIGIRSARLRQGTKVIPARKKGNNFIGGLGNDVEYAAVHEFGATLPPVHIEGNPFLAFCTPEGQAVVVPFVDIPARTIPARPFLTPAVTEASELFIDLEVTRALANGIREIFGESFIGDIGGSALLAFAGD